MTTRLIGFIHLLIHIYNITQTEDRINKMFAYPDEQATIKHFFKLAITNYSDT